MFIYLDNNCFMISQFTPKPLSKGSFTQNFQSEIDKIVSDINLHTQETGEIDDCLQEQLELPELQLQAQGTSFRQLIADYLANKDGHSDPVYGMLQIVEDIISRYNKTITTEHMQEINRKLFENSKDKEIKSQKRLNSTASEFQRSTSNIMDFYLLEIQQLNQKVRDYQQLLATKDKRIKELEFRLFSVETKCKKGRKDDTSQVLLNPFMPNIQQGQSQEEFQPLEDLFEALETIKEVTQQFDDESQSMQRVTGPNLDNNIKLQIWNTKESFNCLSKEQGKGAILIDQNHQSPTQSRVIKDYEAKYDDQYQLHSLQVANLKLCKCLQKAQKSLDDLTIKHRVQQQQIDIVRREKEYYFGELKIKQSQLGKATRVISKFIECKK